MFTGDREVASDAVAEAFAQAIRRGDEVEAPLAWITRAADEFSQRGSEYPLQVGIQGPQLGSMYFGRAIPGSLFNPRPRLCPRFTQIRGHSGFCDRRFRVPNGKLTVRLGHQAGEQCDPHYDG